MAGGFDSLGLLPELIQAVDDLGWLLPTDIQDEAIPLILGGGDVMAAAETGSGKTAAFCLPMIQCCVESLRDPEPKKTISSSGKADSSSSLVSIILNSIDRDDSVTITSNGLSCSSTDTKIWAGMRATHGIKSGKYAYEVTIKGSGICRFGWSTMAAHRELGRDIYGFGYGGTAKKSHDNSFGDYGVKFGDGDIITCYIDHVSPRAAATATATATSGTVSYAVNGKYYGKAFDIPSRLQGSVIFPAVVFKSQGASVGCTVNFGTTSFMHPLERGYNTIASAPSSVVVSSLDKEAYIQKGKRTPLAIILEPARDLAEQVFQNIEDFVRYIDAPSIKPLLLVGGDNANEQQKAFNDGIDIIVGTPGKISDFLQKKIIDMSQVRFLILDEADRLVEDNKELIFDVFRACPSGGGGEHRLQVCFFSATLHSPAITDLSNKICNKATWVDLKGVDAVPETVHHVAYRVNIERDRRLLIENGGAKLTPSVVDDVHVGRIDGNDEKSKLLKAIKQQILLGVIDAFEMAQCMIFCRTNQDCDNLENFLLAHGNGTRFTSRTESGPQSKYSCCVLAGMRSMEMRRASLEAFKSGEIRLLICTDVAARGIDVKGLPYMVNMTLPDEPESYMHRIGRVGRAGTMGLAVSIVAEEGLQERVWYHKCKNRGKDCNNRALHDKGGCTMWMMENDLLDNIEKRLDEKVGNLTPLDYCLPDTLVKTGVIYGEVMEDIVHVPNYHVESLRPKVKELAAMEVQAQNVFWQLRQKFNASGE
jgi:ATP-dependent RNA helicase DDX1